MEISEHLQKVVSSPPAWLLSGESGSIVVSSRIRLARNLAGLKFPRVLSEDQLAESWHDLKGILENADELREGIALEMGQIPELSKQILFERHLISREHLQKGFGCGAVMRKDEFISVMVNEEDHLRIQSFQPGANLREAWNRVDKLDSHIEQKVDYAFSSSFGYLTCCPTNVGTGMRASVLLHLPALALLDEMRPVINAIAKLGLMVRGLWGEGSDIAGHMFQVSNQITLGKEEVEIVDQLLHIVSEISEHEDNARKRLMEANESRLRDHVGRARGILENAHILSSREALDMLSALRLGYESGLPVSCNRECVDDLLLLTQPAHLQMTEGSRLGAEERDEVRAELVKRRLKDFRTDMETKEKDKENNDE